jgi:hypothetical protein
MYNRNHDEVAGKGVAAVRVLSPERQDIERQDTERQDMERQDMAGEILLSLARREPCHALTPGRVEELRASVAEADHGKFAADSEISEAWKKCGLWPRFSRRR